MRLILSLLLCCFSFTLTAQNFAPLPDIYVNPQNNDLQRNALIKQGNPISCEDGSTILYNSELSSYSSLTRDFHISEQYSYAIIESPDKEHRFYGFIAHSGSLTSQKHNYDILWGLWIEKGGEEQYAFNVLPSEIQPFNGKLNGKYYPHTQYICDKVYKATPNDGLPISYNYYYYWNLDFRANGKGTREIKCTSTELAPTRPGGGRRGGGRGIRKITNFSGGYYFTLNGSSKQAFTWTLEGDNVTLKRAATKPTSTCSAKLVESPTKNDENGEPLDPDIALSNRLFNQQCREDFPYNDDVYDGKQTMKRAVQEFQISDGQLQYRILGQTADGCIIAFSGKEGEESDYSKYIYFAKDPKQLKSQRSITTRIISELYSEFQRQEEGRFKQYEQQYKNLCYRIEEYFNNKAYKTFPNTVQYDVKAINIETRLAELFTLCNYDGTSHRFHVLMHLDDNFDILKKERVDKLQPLQDSIIHNHELLTLHMNDKKFKKIYKEYLIEYQILIEKYKDFDQKRSEGNAEPFTQQGKIDIKGLLNQFSQAELDSLREPYKDRIKKKNYVFQAPELYLQSFNQLEGLWLIGKATAFLQLQKKYIDLLPQLE